MQEPFHLRTVIAEPLQQVAKELRPLAESDSAYIEAYNSLCAVLESFHNKLLKTGKGLNKDWEIIPPAIRR
jgi:hypothetical protein